MPRMKRMQSEFTQIFKEDLQQYYELCDKYQGLTTESFAEAFEVSKEAHALLDRWGTMSADARQLGVANKIVKTDIKDYCYRKYKEVEYIHVQARVIWNQGEKNLKEKRVGA